ncbi:N-acetylmuramidase domain-containing protein [Aerosakkonema funiforme]|uniref:DUF3380 domain-containing protein n=2 Tax=Oscillatoriophycideae TaxID=1301283 RepID=A0A926VF07_9CYAN|nr:N-acetylmuramidase domain-containing protein [Aerosakkonema funiforme]MBD2182028.1 DUF3380 domain-containing protein [Aerosakkonema funiforme FACHB-1375]
MKLQDIYNQDNSVKFEDMDRELTQQIQVRLSSLSLLPPQSADGLFGPKTRAALDAFTNAFHLPSGVITKETAKLLIQANSLPLESRLLSERDYTKAADLLNCDIAVIKAVVEVESNGNGFLQDGRPKILFEAHKFSEFTNHRYDLSHPQISSLKWKRELYKGGAKEYPRLEQAISLNRLAALKSASWGLFQIMGFNHNLCGFNDVQYFVAAMYASEGKQLEAFVAYVQNQNLAAFLKNREWAKFAYHYNGESYRANDYDGKLARAYDRWSNSVAILH